MPNLNTPFHPIIYVRGYAMTDDEIAETTADPFCGFNLGSTVYRAVPDKKRPPRKFIFQSPVVRLASDFNYENIYQNGYDILDDEWEADATGRPTGNLLASRSIIIFRYYDQASDMLGSGTTPSINEFARQLGDLVLRIRDLACKNEQNNLSEEDFRCYLVAHSMGGLICRAFLHNPHNDPKGASRYVDKFFTYATPHNGIEIAGMNVPNWLSLRDMNNFNREKMAQYLGLTTLAHKVPDDRVDWIPEERFPSERVFCMVGTNRMDYEVAMGLSRTFAGHGSDGLVKIDSATLHGLKSNGQPGQPCAKAFAYRSHSGHYGIVNSEEGYQNLTRFLFGDVRVDIWLDITDIRLPAEVQKQQDAGRQVNALYQFEIMASPRGKLWYLTRRTAVEDSVACMSHTDWQAAPEENGKQYLSTVFLANRAKVNPDRTTLAYCLTLNVLVPDYEIERKLLFNEHYEGSYLLHNQLIMELTPPATPKDQWTIRYAWQGQGTLPNFKTAKKEDSTAKAGQAEVKIPLPSGDTGPGIEGQLRFVVSAWNRDAAMER
jgi:Predicted acetyltransferases and hydrolases with the alpha/beta hydrolase fold